jgi:hypothetical protein
MHTVLSFTQYTTKPKCSVEMGSHLINCIKAGEMKPRKHPGVMKVKTAEVPAMITNAMQVVMKGKYKVTVWRKACVILHTCLAGIQNIKTIRLMHACLLAHSLTPWCSIFFEKLIVTQFVKRVACYPYRT